MWTTRSPAVSRSRMSRGTTRRIAFGRRTRTVPNSSRSVTNSEPVRSARESAVQAPLDERDGAGRQAHRRPLPVTAASCPASASSSASRGAWSEAITIRGGVPASAARQAVTASTSRRRSAGRQRWLRQPNRSPERQARRRAMAALGAADSQVSSRVRSATQPGASSRVGEKVGRRPVAAAGRPPRSSSVRRSSAWRHRNSAGLGEVTGLVEDQQRAGVDVVEAGARRDERRPDLGGVADLRGT